MRQILFLLTWRLIEVTQDADLIPSGAGFTDGERLVCGPRIQQKLSSEYSGLISRFCS